ncbi:DNA-directed RNA polymerase [Burkholderia vietnamiensis]|uniref:DNA-directed RNA polymerase n=1 Tax=Burkholderia vietnamiensis TaxID=60552 RepID=UPI0007554FB4|nr:DNA-directed RNA polymerase [Burkholderia vietnamiensis]KVR95832.1 DNA-dependent RNA polymerase [Burkholderia vietnamiensis]
MQTIQSYAAQRAAETRVEIDSIPAVRPFARKHVERLQDEGKTTLVIKQLCREAESSRRVSSESSLLAHADNLNLEALQAGLDAFLVALQTAKQTRNKVSPLSHTGGAFNPVNRIPIEDQANAVWDSVCALLGAISSKATDGGLSVQSVASHLARRLRWLAGGAEEYKKLGYERAALVLLDYFCMSTEWLAEVSGARRIASARQKPNTYALTPKFIDDVLGGGMAADFSERRPMLVPPVPWTTTATHGGYLHSGIQAVRGTTRPIGSPVIVNALNALQATPFRVNQRVLEVARSFKECAEEPAGKLVLGRYMESSHADSEAVRKAKTIRSALTISALSELLDAEEFYFPWNLDWRGRMYPATSMISPQGADLCKGCLEFADGTPLGREGATWLAIHLCNLAGADKEVIDGGYRTRTPEERKDWTLAHTEEIMRVSSDPLMYREWHLVGGFGLQKIKRGKVVPVAVDKPWQFLAACFEWAGYQYEGTAFRSRLAGALDGSCSGVQMLAGMTRDQSAGAMVNLVPAPRGDDYYGRMAESLAQKLYNRVDTADAGEMTHLRYWSEQTLDRDLLKAPSMTKVYSAGAYTFAEQVRNKTDAPEQECMWLAARINECFGDVAPGMLRAMGYLQAVSDVLTDAGIPLRWVTPAGLQVEQARYGEQSVRMVTSVAGSTRERLFYIDGDTLSKKGQRAGVAPNFVHGVDASHMAMVVNDLYAKGVRNYWMIHDSFGAPFAQCDEVFRSTREQFVKLMSGDLLRDWTEHVTSELSDAARAKLPNLPEYGDLDLNAVRDSVYAWF